MLAVYCHQKSLNHKEKHHFCLRCLNSFWTHKYLNKHLEYCGNHEAVKINMPEKGTMLKFKNYHGGKGSFHYQR